MKKTILFMTILFTAMQAYANDTAGMILPTGAIKFTATKDIELLEETLYIRRDLVEVNYIFKNKSDKEIEKTVIFPLPKVSVSEFEFTKLPNLNFQLWVNGKREKVSENFQLLANGVNVTQYFKDIFKNYYDYIDPVKLNKLSQEQADKLRGLGAIEDNIDCRGNFYSQRACRKHKYNISGNWEKEVGFYWTQKFPPNQTIEIKHRYIPSTMGFSLGEGYFRKKYSDEMMSQDENGERKYSATSLEYILTTANNWDSSIRNFSLLVEAPCKMDIFFEGDEILTDTKYFAKNLTNFSPTDEIKIDFMTCRSDRGKQEPKRIPYGVRIDGPANLRAKPNGKILKSMKDDSYAWVLGQKNDWYEIISEDTHGWTHKDNIKDRAFGVSN
jgi:Domain of unknown function (DUF4424)